MVLSGSGLNIDAVLPVPDSVETTEDEATTLVPTSDDSPLSAPTPVAEPVPVTDGETIASMVAEGMDPSFLDALPEEMRRELMSDHRRTRQMRSQISAMQLPDTVSTDFLNSLPPNLQEEVFIKRNTMYCQT